jgi:hypothetical protein
VGDHTAVDGCSCRDQQHGDVVGAPGQPVANRARDHADLPGQCREEVLEVRDRRFDLDDEQDPLAGVPRQDVDGPTVTEDVEGELRDDLPIERAEDAHDVLDDRGVGTIKQAIAFTSTPLRRDDESHVEPGRHPTR